MAASAVDIFGPPGGVSIVPSTAARNLGQAKTPGTAGGDASQARGKIQPPLVTAPQVLTTPMEGEKPSRPKTAISAFSPTDGEGVERAHTLAYPPLVRGSSNKVAAISDKSQPATQLDKLAFLGSLGRLIGKRVLPAAGRLIGGEAGETAARRGVVGLRRGLRSPLVRDAGQTLRNTAAGGFYGFGADTAYTGITGNEAPGFTSMGLAAPLAGRAARFVGSKALQLGPPQTSAAARRSLDLGRVGRSASSAAQGPARMLQTAGQIGTVGMAQEAFMGINPTNPREMLLTGQHVAAERLANELGFDTADQMRATVQRYQPLIQLLSAS